MTTDPRPDPVSSLDEDPLLGPLRDLPVRDLEADRAEAIRRRAQLALARSARFADRPWLGSLARVYRLGLEPAFVLAVVFVYLAWALFTVSDLLTLPPVR